MPLYEYLCGSCGRSFERIQKFSDPRVTECPACGGAVEKLPSSPAIQFKGSGFYITDYAKPGSKDASPGTATTGDKSTPAVTPAASAPAASATETKSTPAPAPAPAKADVK
jgi:putative FmdB family regulatory protein